MDYSVFGVKGNVVIITGGSRGIGRAIALAFADAGANVVITGRKLPDLEKTAGEIKAKGVKVLPLTVDVREGEQINDMVKKTVNEFGRIDVLVNNAGGSFNSTFLDLAEKGWDALMRENLKSVYLSTQAAGRVMVEQKKGAVVSITSVAAFMPEHLGSAYSAAKAGVVNLTRYLAAEWGPYNVRVNSVAPGFTLTEGAIEYLKTQPERVDKRRKRIPLQKFGEPQDMAMATLFLASDLSKFTSGVTLVVDGGVSAVLPEST